jgi:hypothetical protein
VTTSIVTRKLQEEHANWKLTDRRVNKFVKRFMDKHKNPAGADDDQTASMYKKGSSKRGLFGIFSPSKRSNLVTDPEPIEEETPNPATPKAEAPPTPNDPESPEGAQDSASSPPASSENEQVVQEVASKDIAYEQDNSVVDSPQDCWGLGNNCSVM